MRERPYILSFSRKTDGPRYYSEWFEGSWRRGFAEARSSFGGPIRAELGPQNVAALLGWTRDARPFARCLELLRSEGVPTAWQVTLTAFGRDLEPARPKDDVGAFLWLRERLPDSTAIEWRYDPIIVCDRYPESFHLEAFARLAGALRGATRVCNTSIVEAFRKTVRRLGDASVGYRPNERLQKAATSAALRAFQPSPGFIEELARIAAREQIELRGCVSPELGLSPSRCGSLEMFRGYGARAAERLSGSRASPSRPGCRCVQSVDIGMVDTCVAGCSYCYAVSSERVAIANRRLHDPATPMIRRSSGAR